MKIVQVSPRYYPYAGGTEKFVKTLAEELVGRGFEVTVLATEPELKEQYVRKLVNGVEIFLFKSYAPAEIGYLSPALTRALRRIKEGIIHAHGYRSFPMLETALVKGRKVKLIVTTHLGFSKVGEWLYKVYNPLFGNIIFSKADKIVVVSPTEMERVPLLRKFSYKVVWVPIGISMSGTRFDMDKRKYSKNKLNLLYVGRIEKRKGIDHLLRLMSVLDKDKFCLTIVGSGPYTKQLVNTLDRSKLCNVKFTGRISERKLQELYLKSDLFILFSEYEGHSVALTEAMVNGLVPIVTDVGGNRYVVGDTGFLIKYPCDIDEVCRILYHLYDDREELVARSIKAQMRVRKLFSISQIAELYIRIYEEVLSQ